ncbi:MAG: hypothetical protein ACYSR6_14020, partial [Planctomycetota bacterium]
MSRIVLVILTVGVISCSVLSDDSEVRTRICNEWRPILVEMTADKDPDYMGTATLTFRYYIRYP